MKLNLRNIFYLIQQFLIIQASSFYVIFIKFFELYKKTTRSKSSQMEYKGSRCN